MYNIVYIYTSFDKSDECWFTYSLLTCVSTYLLIYLLAYLLTCLFTYLLIYLLTYLLVYLLTCLSTYLLIYLLIYLLAYILRPTRLSIYLLIDLLAYLLTCLSTYLPIFKMLITREGNNVGSKKYDHWCKENERYSRGEFDVATLNDSWSFRVTEEQKNTSIYNNYKIL